MSEFVVAVLAFLSMMGAALLGLFSKTRLPSEHLQDDIHSVVGLVANLFVVMTALVLGLMLSSAKNTFETNNRDIRTLATESHPVGSKTASVEPGSRGRPSASG